MATDRNRRFWKVLCGFIVGVTISAGGCGGKDTVGKFTPEQMSRLPLAQKDELPAPSGGMVLSLKGQTITIDEIAAPAAKELKEFAGSGDFERFAGGARPVIKKIVLDKVADILLYEQAKKTAPENIDELLEKAVEGEIKRFVADFNNNYAEARSQIEKMGLVDWAGFREYQKKLMLTQSYLSKELAEDKPIGYAELLGYYESGKKQFYRQGKVEFRLIDIIPSKLRTQDNASAQQQAVKLAEELLGKISRGEDFGTLAEKYSQDHRAQFGGLWTPVSADSALVKPYDTVLEQARKMQPGQLAGPIETEDHVFIIRLESKQESGYIPFDQVQSRLENELKFRKRKARYEKFVSGLVEQAQIPDMDRFIDFCIDRTYLKITKG